LLHYVTTIHKRYREPGRQTDGRTDGRRDVRSISGGARLFVPAYGMSRSQRD